MIVSLDEDRDRVLIDNTAQAVLKELQALEHNRSSCLLRWVWELIQNARDAAPSRQSAQIKICLTTQELTFSHNGSPFSSQEIAHLIYHGSTKQSSQNSIGQFGTGFLTTHLISRRIRVKGLLQDGQRFDFILDRVGDSPEALSLSMQESWNQFKGSLSNPVAEADGGYTTEFIYPITEDTFAVGKVGVEDLEKNAPYVLAFNPSLSAIMIEQEGRVVKLARHESNQSEEKVRVVSVSRREYDNRPTEALVALADDGEVSAALLLQHHSSGLCVATALVTPKIYLAFPLIDTEDFALPLVVNSLAFTPNEDRGGIWLGKSDDEANLTNQKLLERALSLTSNLLVHAIKNEWQQVHNFLRLPTLNEKSWLGVEWYREFVSTLIGEIRSISVLRTADNRKIIPQQAWVPISSEGIDLKAIWKLVAGLRDALSKLPPQELAEDWQAIYKSWAAIEGHGIDSYEECLTLEKLVKRISDLGNIEVLRNELSGSTGPTDWLNLLYDLILRSGQTDLFDKLEFLPDQTGSFRHRNKLYTDFVIDDQLKNIAERLGLNVRASLLDSKIRLGAELLQPKTDRQVLAEVLNELKIKAANEPLGESFKQTNVSLFTWMMSTSKWDYFEAYPALTEGTGDRERGLINKLTNSVVNLDERPMAPWQCWPNEAQPYVDLFPKRYLLSAAYHESCPNDSLWATLADKGYCRIIPIYETEDRIIDFLPDEPLSDLAKGSIHKLTNPVSLTTIAFLKKEDVGLIETVRRSKTKAQLFLNFIVSFMLDADPHAFDIHIDSCECGERHKFFLAGWLVPLKKRKWVPLEKNVASEPTADSLAQLIHEDEALVTKMSEEKTASLLEAIGVSVADLLLRTVAGDEHARTSLTRSASDLLHAAGGNIEKVRALAQAIKEEPKLLDVIEREKQTREKIHRNQAVGQQVENLLRSSFEKEGIRVTRTGVGSDFEVEHDLVESGTEMAFEVHKAERSYLIEVKATTDLSVRMTVTQGYTATRERDRFILCIVRLKSADISEGDIREGARFISNIGNLIEPLYEEYKKLDKTRRAATTKSGDIELEMTESETRFRVGLETWSSGESFDEFVKQILGST